MSFWNNSLFGFITKALTGTTNNNLGTLLNKADSETDLYGSVQSYFDKVTGRQLTAAEREANAFSEQQAVNAWNRDMAARSTAFQTQVQDMRAAGLNPMMAASGSGAAVPSSASPTSVSPSGASFNLGSLLSAVSGLAMLPKQKQLIDAQIQKANADANKANAEANKTNQDFDYFERVSSLREEGERLSNEMQRSEMREIESRIKKLAADEKNSIAQSILANANADNIKFMQPFISANYEANSSHVKQLSKLAAVEAAYQQGLIDNGSIAAYVRQMNANASEHEIDTKTKAFAQSINDGSLQKAADALGDWRTGVVAGLYTALNGAVKSVLGKW